MGADLDAGPVDSHADAMPCPVVLSVTGVVAENVLFAQLLQDFHEYLINLTDLIDFDDPATTVDHGFLEKRELVAEFIRVAPR